MGSSFNLIDEPWIPCIQLQGGRAEDYSIRDVFLRANEFREVQCDSPLATVSILRLLLAIVYSATRKVDEYDIEGFWESGLPLDKIESYLDRWHDRFYLFHPKYPFYQTAGLDLGEKVSGINKLATEMASGHNPTLFDHSSDENPMELELSQLARFLVAAQSFACGGGKSSSGSLGKKKIKPPNFADAVLVRGVTVWLNGKNLFETFLLNLVPYSRDNQDDLPPWELEHPVERCGFVDTGEKAIASRGMIDQYTWQSRLILLLPSIEKNSRPIRHLYWTQGRSADKKILDPMKAYLVLKGKGFQPLPISKDKDSWRNAHAILTRDFNRGRCPAAIRQVKSLINCGVLDGNIFLEMNVVGLATAPNKAGKFLLWRHDRMPVAAVLIEDENLVERLETLISNAETVATQLRWAAKQLCRNYLSLGEGNAGADDTEHLLASINPLQSYWARLEGRFYRLLSHLPSDPDGATKQWHETIEQEAYRAYEESARTLGESVRAITARAKTIPYFDPNKGGKPKKSREEVQS